MFKLYSQRIHNACFRAWHTTGASSIRTEAIGGVPEDTDTKLLGETVHDAVNGVLETTVAMRVGRGAPMAQTPGGCIHHEGKESRHRLANLTDEFTIKTYSSY